MERKVIKLTEQEARDAIFGDHPDFDLIGEEVILDHTRWHVHYGQTLLHIPTGEFYGTTYRVGATEYQDTRPFEYEGEVEFGQVFKTEKVVVTYE
jgi:hypothetical protein